MQRWMQVLWPSFLAATVADGLLFSLVDPDEMVILGHSYAGERLAAYTCGFFGLWAVCALSSALTLCIVLDYPFWRRHGSH